MLAAFSELEPEHRLLLACARPRIGDDARARIAALLEAVDWRRVVGTAEAHGVMALVLRRIGAPGVGVSPGIAAAGDRYLAKQAERNAALTQTLKVILQAFAIKGVEAIAFKGPVVAQLAYGDAALRRYRDLDILVREKDASVACDILTELGFRNADAFTPAQQAAVRRYSGQDIVFKDGVAVEPHWALAPRTLSLNLDYDGLFARACDVDLGGVVVRSFGPEDLVLVLCLHGSKEEWTRLLWIADLAHMIEARPDLDWGVLLKRAREQGSLRMVLVGLILAADLLDSIPPPVQEAIARDPEARALADRAASRLFDADRREASIYRLSAFRWRMRERSADRMRYLIRTVVTPRDIHFSLMRLPDALFSLYVPLKLAHDYALLPIWILSKRLGGSRRG